MKEIKIGLDRRDEFERMRAGSLKKIILAMMDEASGEKPGTTPRPVAPTEEQVSAYMRHCLNVPEDVAGELARGFVSYYDEHGWKNRYGKAIRRWENCALGWVRKNVNADPDLGQERQSPGDDAPSIGASDDARSDVTRDNASACMEEYKALEEQCSFGDEYKALGEEYKELLGKLCRLEARRKALKMRFDAFKERRKGIMGMGAGIKTNHGRERDANAGGAAFPPEDWEIIDKNWETLKDAVYRMKVKKEAARDINLPAECWKVLGKYFDELSTLFHL